MTRNLSHAQKRTRLFLPEEEPVVAVITQYHKPIPERPDHRWDYFEYDPSGHSIRKRYAQLFSYKDLSLFPGEAALVVGREVEQIYSARYLHIDEVRGEKVFLVTEGNKYLASSGSATETRTPNATHFDWITIEVNGWPVNINVPALAFGKRSHDIFPSGNIEVTRVVRPENRARKDGYFLYANFVE